MVSRLEFARDSHVNIPIAVLIWAMIYPMMLKVDFSSIGGVARKPKGLLITLLVNWIIKPLSMAFLAWVFIQHLFSTWITPEAAKDYTAGLIILAAAPCTAMVFVWSYLTDGDPVYTLVQVAVNDLIMLVAFAPIVMILCGVANVVVPSSVLITSVVVFIVIPLAAGYLTRSLLLKARGKQWFEEVFPSEVSADHHRRFATDFGAHFCVSGSESDPALVCSPPAGCAHYHSGLFQFQPDVPGHALAQGSLTTSPRRGPSLGQVTSSNLR